MNTIQAAVAGEERVFEVMDEVPDLTDMENARSISKLKGEVEFKDVHFGYTPDREILKGITLSAKPGETIALIGPTGSGKTTIINLLSRFYDIQSGSITIYGQDLKEYRIYVIHEGEIIEKGTHLELLEKQGFYFQLYESQFDV